MSGIIRHLGLFVLLLGILLPVSFVNACAAVGRGTDRFRIAAESAVIVWDAKTKTEHFIRRAAFHTNAYNFGFLVPTPSIPELGEANDAVFSTFDPLLRPKIVHERPTVGFPFLSALFDGGFMAADKGEAAPMDSAGVRVLNEQRVAGYDAVVLEADSPAALNDWLGKHGYTSRPALEKWLAPYIVRKWKITAFKLAGDPQKDGGVGARAVRMSFKTEQPFYPYREPEDASEIAAIEGRSHDQGRSLRVYFFGTERMSGSIGDKEPKAWPGQTKWSGRVEENRWKVVHDGLGKPGEQLPAEPWLTIFDDKSSPRPGTDEVYFGTAGTQAEVSPDPIVIFDKDNPLVPLDLVGLILLLGLGVFWLIRRITRAAAPAVA